MFWKGHSIVRYVHSLAPLTCSAVLRFTTLILLARSVHGLAHSLGSLPHETFEILEYVLTRHTEINATIVTRNTP